MREALKDNTWGLHEAAGFGVLIVMAAINLGLYRYKYFYILKFKISFETLNNLTIKPKTLMKYSKWILYIN